MFSQIIDAINTGINAIQRSLGWLMNTTRGLWVIFGGFILAVIGVLKYLVQMANDFLVQMALYLDALITNINNSPSVSNCEDALAFMNTFFPVEEMFAFMMALSALWIVANAYRFIKSMIPTMS